MITMFDHLICVYVIDDTTQVPTYFEIKTVKIDQ